ncbi:hypothetical protein [Zymobacter sp. IVIA_12111.31 C1]|uniref:hypothetical protein n=1 Tax=Zymobacter sp. IVIA_12111.31 C1 TaxID=3394854 RepID=UPI0039C13F3C
MAKEKRENRLEIRLSDFELACLRDRVKKTKFKNNSDYIRATIFIADLVRQELKNRDIDFYSEEEIYNKIDRFREQRQLEKIARKQNKKHVTVPQIDPKLLNQIIRTGNNLNQIAYSVNKAIRYNEKIDAYEILSHLLEIENQNKEIIELMKVSKYQKTKNERPIEEENDNSEGGESDDSRIY